MNKPDLNTYILLVDDDEDDCEQISDAFLKINARENLRIIHSGKRMFDYLDNLPDTNFYPALIVMDYYLHMMNGEEILKQLKKNDKYKFIPVIFYSSQLYSSLKKRLSGLGVQSFYEKEINPSNTIQFVKELTNYLEHTKVVQSINRGKE